MAFSSWSHREFSSLEGDSLMAATPRASSVYPLQRALSFLLELNILTMNDASFQVPWMTMQQFRWLWQTRVLNVLPLEHGEYAYPMPFQVDLSADVGAASAAAAAVPWTRALAHVNQFVVLHHPAGAAAAPAATTVVAVCQTRGLMVFGSHFWQHIPYSEDALLKVFPDKASVVVYALVRPWPAQSIIDEQGQYTDTPVVF